MFMEGWRGMRFRQPLQQDLIALQEESLVIRNKDRSISLREGAMLQTFPKDFLFTGSKVDMARQIGNAVPPLLAKQIGTSIIDCYKRSGKI